MLEDEVPHCESTRDSALQTLTIACWGHMSAVSETISILKEICKYTANEDNSIKYNYRFNIWNSRTHLPSYPIGTNPHLCLTTFYSNFLLTLFYLIFKFNMYHMYF